MHGLPRIQDLPTEEIARLLEQQGQEVPAVLVADLKVLLDEIGGIETDYADDETDGALRRAA